MINSAMNLGRRLLPPVGATIEVLLERAPNAPWRVKIVDWYREDLESRNGSRYYGITGLLVECAGGQHLLTLDELQRCDIVELPDDAPHFTTWPSLIDLSATPVRMKARGVDAPGIWTVALEMRCGP
jgi:hypothetical protein